MKDWRIFISDTLVKWFKQLGILGWVRFRILRFAYKIFWQNSPRNGEWDFVLSWLKPLREWQKPIYVLDVGCTESLLIYELAHRGYEMTGLDQRDYQEKLPYSFMKFDLTSSYWVLNKFDYIVAISTIEHIGLGAYEDVKNDTGDKNSICHIYNMLKPNGYFIITVPNKHLGTETGRGYSYREFENLMQGLFKIIHFEERSNQICAVLVKD